MPLLPLMICHPDKKWSAKTVTAPDFLRYIENISKFPEHHNLDKKSFTYLISTMIYFFLFGAVFLEHFPILEKYITGRTLI